MARSLFFPNYEAFQEWVRGIPAIFPCREDPRDPRLTDPRDPCYPTTEGPYYVTPEYLLIRAGKGKTCRYNALVRVNSEAKADYRWYVPAPRPGQDGQTVFAAYLWDRREHPKKIVGGVTLREARAALGAFLTTKPGRGKRV